MVIQKDGGRYSLYCTECHCWIPNTANYEMRKEGFFAHSHVCHNGICDFKNGEMSDEEWQRIKAEKEKK